MTTPARFPALSRRTLLAAAAALPVAVSPVARAGSSGSPLRVGLVGCGGRGTGAALQAFACGDVRIAALADLDADRVEESARLLAAAGMADASGALRRCIGADAWRSILETPLDAVILAAPPATRPVHLAAAVAAGLHCWVETPAAIDDDGLGIAARALDRAERERLVVASGLCSRFDAPTATTIERVRAGAVGKVRSIALHHDGHLPWRRSVAPGTTPADERLRNWIWHASLSGGHLVEHHVHALDRALWILGDDEPVRVEAVLPPEAPVPGYGDVPAGLHVRYVFASGAVVEASCRRTSLGGTGRLEEVVGSRGRADLVAARVDGPDGRWGAEVVPAHGRGAMFAAGMADFLRLVRSSGGGAERVAGGRRLVRATALAVAGTVAAAGRVGTAGSGRA